MQLTNAIKLKKKINIINYNKKRYKVSSNKLLNESTTDYIDIDTNSNDFFNETNIEELPVIIVEEPIMKKSDPIYDLAIKSINIDSFDDSSEYLEDHIYDIADNSSSEDETYDILDDKQYINQNTDMFLENNSTFEFVYEEPQKTIYQESFVKSTIKQMNELKKEYLIEQQTKKQKSKN
jgi:hypothetical protein